MPDAPAANAPGYLVLALGTSPQGNSIFFDYSSADGKVSKEAEWVSMNIEPNDFDDGHGNRGVVYVQALPPGLYRFRRIAENDGSFVYNWPLSIQFTVTPGHVTYAGDFDFIPYDARNFLGLMAPAGGYFSVNDSSARDIPIAARKAKQPLLPQMPVDRLIVEPDILAKPPFALAPSAAK